MKKSPFVCEYDYTSCHMTQDEINQEALDYINELYPGKYDIVAITREEFCSLLSPAEIKDYADACTVAIKCHPSLIIYERFGLAETCFNPGLNAERWAYFSVKPTTNTN